MVSGISQAPADRPPAESDEAKPASAYIEEIRELRQENTRLRAILAARADQSNPDSPPMRGIHQNDRGALPGVSGVVGVPSVPGVATPAPAGPSSIGL
jgi:hypothetical protein